MKIPWSTIWLVVAIVFATLYIKSLFDKIPPNEKIIRSDMKIEQYEKQRIIDSTETSNARRERDSVIAISDQRFKNLENQKQPIRNAIKQIPAVVNNFDKEQLRRAITNF